MLDNAPMQGGVCWREWVLGGFVKPPQHRWVDVLGAVVMRDVQVWEKSYEFSADGVGFRLVPQPNEMRFVVGGEVRACKNRHDRNGM